MTALLEKLLRLGEARPDRSRPASVRVNYTDYPLDEDVEALHRLLKRAEGVGAITARHGGIGRRHLVDSVVLRDATALATLLGRTPAPERADRLRRLLDPYMVAPWLSALADTATERWQRGEAAFGIFPDDSRTASQCFAMLAAVARGLADGVDPRSFSIRAGLDSKAFHRNESRLVTLLRVGLDLADLDRDEIVGAIGLVKFPHPVLLHGPVEFRLGDAPLASGCLKPYIGVPPDTTGHPYLIGRPDALLTIENFASFNRHVAESGDNAIVVYVGGFPSPGTLRLLARLLSVLPDSVPFLHWGDIDSGGIRIFRHLETGLPRRPRPHLMTTEIAVRCGTPATADRRLERLAASDSALSTLAEFLSGPGAMTVEQEILDPVPLHPTGDAS